ncbi:MarR family winged helix-turn-helix transcriptional regulator [Bosea sp. NBC_00550]|uniref:MarR family winged helix-turn-helix transcriptional regulator n=1 Tax=Bosea sp. NBC_00550 TaxID=2969621 RepID=UPI0022305BB0|nr:MarR family transcriptional regulator [Bosea sp. NBC_00550]UZF90613.1 MarR family transcriptional regulator [Bosea sp. NBC_00550]
MRGRARASTRRPEEPGEKPSQPAVGRPNGYVLDEQVGFLMRRAQQRHISIFQQTIGENGPTPTQFAALSKLAAGGEDISQNQLGRMTAMDPATIKGVIARLAERGLVERLPDPNDQRRILIRLSEQGQATIPELFEKAKAITAATLEPLSREEAKQLLALLAKLG